MQRCPKDIELLNKEITDYDEMKEFFKDDLLTADAKIRGEFSLEVSCLPALGAPAGQELQ